MGRASDSLSLTFLAHGFTSWASGALLLRACALPALIGVPPSEAELERFFGLGPAEPEPRAERAGLSRWRRVVRWLMKEGADGNAGDLAVWGACELLVAYALLIPLSRPSRIALPHLLLTPFAPLPLPLRLPGTPPPLKHLLPLTLLFALFHETQRSLVLWLSSRGLRSRLSIQGSPHPHPTRAKPSLRRRSHSRSASAPPSPESDAEAEQDICLICFEPPAADRPLEQFCVQQPSKHAFHRECFVRWFNSHSDGERHHALLLSRALRAERRGHTSGRPAPVLTTNSPACPACRQAVRVVVARRAVRWSEALREIGAVWGGRRVLGRGVEMGIVLSALLGAIKARRTLRARRGG